MSDLSPGPLQNVMLPRAADPRGNYAPCVRSGSLLYTAGQTPRVDGTLLARGRLGAEIDTATAQASFRRALLNALAALATVEPDLPRIRVLRVVTFVACVPNFRHLANVAADGPAILSQFVLAEPPVSTLVGVTVLPDDAPVEIEILAQVIRSTEGTSK